MTSSASSILELFTSHWVSAVLASAVELRIFEELEAGAASTRELARRSSLSARTVQTLLDGLVALGLVARDSAGNYANSEAASAHLVSGKQGYLGGFSRILTGPGDGGMRQWSMLPTALRQGKPIAPETIVQPDSPFWPELVKVLTPLSREAAAIAAELVGISEGQRTARATRRAMSVLDIGGGAGAYSQVWLALDPDLTMTQLDWAPVNALARESLSALGFDGRFITIDGDLHGVPFAAAAYDVVILSNICHHESPSGNLEILRKIAPALAPGGQVVISEFTLHDDRRGPKFAALFGAGMLLQTPEGASYCESDYQAWLEAAGFEPARVDRRHPISTLLVAKLRAAAA
jgi:SAM-dependent methyltransferase